MPLVRRFGRPGLLGTIGRTAVITGTATMTARAIQRHSEQRAAEPRAYAEQQSEPAATYSIPAAREATANPPAAAAPDLVDRLSRLAQLRSTGALTEEEFAAAKAQLLH